MTVSIAFLNSAIKRLAYYKDLGDKAMAQVTDTGFHYQPNETSNSIAIIIQHMAGNMLSRWTDFLTADGEKEWRHRDAEFEEQQWSKAQLLDYWEKGWACCLNTLQSLTPDDLLKTITIRSEELVWWMLLTGSWHIIPIMWGKSFTWLKYLPGKVGKIFLYLKGNRKIITNK